MAWEFRGLGVKHLQEMAQPLALLLLQDAILAQVQRWKLWFPLRSAERERCLLSINSARNGLGLIKTSLLMLSRLKHRGVVCIRSFTIPLRRIDIGHSRRGVSRSTSTSVAPTSRPSIAHDHRKVPLHATGRSFERGEARICASACILFTLQSPDIFVVLEPEPIVCSLARHWCRRWNCALVGHA